MSSFVVAASKGVSALLFPSLPSFPLLPSTSDPDVPLPAVSDASVNLEFDFEPPPIYSCRFLPLDATLCAPLLHALNAVRSVGTEISPIVGHEVLSKKIGRSAVLVGVGGLVSLPSGFESTELLPAFPPYAPRASGGFRPRGRSDLHALFASPRCFLGLPPSSLIVILSSAWLGLLRFVEREGVGGALCPPVSAPPNALIKRSWIAFGSGDPVAIVPSQVLVAVVSLGALLGSL